MCKLWIIAILGMLIFAGCGAHPYSDNSGFVADDTTKTEATTATASATTMTSTTTAAVATTTATTKPAVQARSVMTTQIEVTIKKMEEKIIELNIETQRGDGTLTIKSVRLYYNENIDKNIAAFSYETSDKIAAIPIEEQTKCIGKSGKTYVCKGMFGTGNKGEIHIYNVPDFSDLSTVTVTYAFEGYDPVTVTFDIPGL